MPTKYKLGVYFVEVVAIVLILFGLSAVIKPEVDVNSDRVTKMITSHHPNTVELVIGEVGKRKTVEKDGGEYNVQEVTYRIIKKDTSEIHKGELESVSFMFKTEPRSFKVIE